VKNAVGLFCSFHRPGRVLRGSFFLRRHSKVSPIDTALESALIAPLSKAGAIDAQEPVVISSTVHLIAQALLRFDNRLPTCQRAGELPMDSMTQLGPSLALRSRDCLGGFEGFWGQIP
jgi:hypothetical protein